MCIRDSIWIVAQDDRCAIALVNIQVNHRDLQSVAVFCTQSASSFNLHLPGGDCHIVKDAKSAALVRVGVMGATRQIR